MKTQTLLAIACTLPLTAAAFAQAPPIDPITSKVKNVREQFLTMNDHGTPSGFTRGAIDPGRFGRHYQGISRHPTRTDIFFSSKSGNQDSPAAVLGILLSEEDGTRQMNHNLWAKGSNNTHQTHPIGTAMTFWEDRINDVCHHFGGLQASGKVMAVAAEDCDGGTHGSSARVYLYYIHDSDQPVAIDVTADGMSGQDSADVGFSTAGAAGIIEDAPGLYTVMVFTDGNKRVRFRQFELTGTTMTATSNWLTYVTPTNWLTRFVTGWHTGGSAHQSLNLIRQDNDTLFVGGAQRSPTSEQDYMFLYRVSGLSYDNNGHLSGNPSLIYEAAKHMYCTNWESTASRMCDFQAAAGFYVASGASGNANGELIVLAIAHDDDKGPHSNLAPITEFRNKNVRTIDSGYGDCGTSSWATLYDDDHMDGDRNITITEYNSDLDDFKHLHNSSIDFGDKASALSYCIRLGCTLTAYNNSGYSSPTITITGSGTGTFGFDNDLKRTSGGFIGTNWSNKGDKISSVKITCE